MGIAYHSSANGKSKVLNKILKDYLCYFVTGKGWDWEILFPYAKYSYNSSVSSSTGYTPFELVNGKILLFLGVPSTNHDTNLVS